MTLATTLNANAYYIPLADETAQCCVTSPPFFRLRSYLDTNDPLKHLEIGSEPTPELYVANLVAVFREVRRVLRSDGVVLLNLGDSYASSGQQGNVGQTSIFRSKPHHSRKMSSNPLGRAPTPIGLKPKDLCMIPARVALALQADGWWLRSAIPWLKKNAMPESVTDRFTTAHEYWFLLAKSKRYFWDADAVKTPFSWPNAAGVPFGGQKYPDSGVANGTYSGKLYYAEALSGRNRRTSDIFFDSLDVLIEHQRQYLAHLEHVRDKGGFLLDENGDPLALVVNTASYAKSHFATFPPKLVEPLILASTSAKGACPVCGAAWVRIVEPTPEYAAVKASMIGKTHQDVTLELERGKDQGWGRQKARVTKETVTIGWQPQCTCYGSPELGPVPCCKCGGTGRGQVYKTEAQRVIEAKQTGRTDGKVAGPGGQNYKIETGSPCPACNGAGTVEGDVWPDDVDTWLTVPCLVLDPFAGTSTVGQVCIQHRRSFVGLELNRAYIALAQERTSNLQVRLGL